MKLWMATAAFFFAGVLTTAFAQEKPASAGMSIHEIAAVLEGEGLSAVVSSGGEAGNIRSELSGVAFEVFTFNCNAASRCTEFLFIVGFDLPNGFPLELINDWNAQKMAGRAYLDAEGDPFLDHIVSVSSGGDEAVFQEALYLWAAALDSYIDFIELPAATV